MLKGTTTTVQCDQRISKIDKMESDSNLIQFCDDLKHVYMGLSLFLRFGQKYMLMKIKSILILFCVLLHTLTPGFQTP